MALRLPPFPLGGFSSFLEMSALPLGILAAMFPFPHSGTASLAVREARLLWCAVPSALYLLSRGYWDYSGVAPTLTFFTHREGERRSRLRHVFGTRTRSGLVQSTRCRPASGSHSRYDASRGIEPLPLSSWPYAVCKVRRCKLNLQHSYGHTKWLFGVHEKAMRKSSPWPSGRATQKKQ